MTAVQAIRKIDARQQQQLLEQLSLRFEKNPHRHKGIHWEQIAAHLQDLPDKLWSLQQMEATGGEPDVIGTDETSGAFLFADCSPESPSGRRSLCYDESALEGRKEARPAGSVLALAARMGIELLNEKQYRLLQQLGPFDTKTSSWLQTPNAVRALGGALFGDFRFGQAFVYHNGAQSYYAARGFRGVLKV